ncbi:XRE family transcriptional regulator [Streptococcaceae bacterium ESL0729]|nr:XRE family transcriptional regulator [Streptococcaceae bacterium ESL0729]
MSQKIADLDLIEWVLETQTGYKIFKGTGIAQSTISDWKKGKTLLEKMTLANAVKLTNYAKKLKDEQV